MARTRWSTWPYEKRSQLDREIDRLFDPESGV